MKNSAFKGIRPLTSTSGLTSHAHQATQAQILQRFAQQEHRGGRIPGHLATDADLTLMDLCTRE
jgi:hypothetical protein